MPVAAGKRVATQAAMDDLATLLPTSKATWLLIVAGVTTLAFALSAFASDRLGHTIVSPFLSCSRRVVVRRIRRSSMVLAIAAYVPLLLFAN